MSVRISTPRMTTEPSIRLWEERIFGLINSLTGLLTVLMAPRPSRELPPPQVPANWAVLRILAQSPFLVLTKRSKRLLALAPFLPWPPNVWIGVSIESPEYFFRIDDLRQVPATVRFLSLEPLLEPLPGLDLTGIHWVIVGGESGAGARPMEPAWPEEIRLI